jgi:hypothetical protein
MNKTWRERVTSHIATFSGIISNLCKSIVPDRLSQYFVKGHFIELMRQHGGNE